MDAQENVYMKWHLFKVNAHTVAGRSNQTGTVAADKQTRLESFVIITFLLLVLNSVFQRFAQCLMEFIVVYCIAL